MSRFISPDPLIPMPGSSTAWNRYAYVLNNPLKYADSTGNFAFLPWLLKAGTEAAVDALVQAAFAYYFDPEVTTMDEAIDEISWRQAAWAGATGLLPGSGLAKSAAVAVGDVLINFAELGDDYTAEQALQDFIVSVGAELVGEKAGELAAKYGPEAFEAGLRKLGLSGGCSFSADTLILTEVGLQPIVELVIGDIVYAYNEETGEFGWYPVTATFSHLDSIIVYLIIDGELIETTLEHPFMVMKVAPWLATGQVEVRWIEASELSTGDDVRRADGSTGEVDRIAAVAVRKRMYNLTVGGAHTFFVGNGQWLVHNACIRDRMSSKSNTSNPLPAWTATTAWQAHHVVLRQLGSHTLIRQATAAGWDIDSAINGIALPKYDADGVALGSAVHRGSHANYTKYVEKQLDTLLKKSVAKGWTPQQQIQALNNLIQNTLVPNIQSRPAGTRLD